MSDYWFYPGIVAGSVILVDRAVLILWEIYSVIKIAIHRRIHGW